MVSQGALIDFEINIFTKRAAQIRPNTADIRLFVERLAENFPEKDLAELSDLVAIKLRERGVVCAEATMR